MMHVERTNGDADLCRMKQTRSWFLPDASFESAERGAARHQLKENISDLTTKYYHEDAPQPCCLEQMKNTRWTVVCWSSEARLKKTQDLDVHEQTADLWKVRSMATGSTWFSPVGNDLPAILPGALGKWLSNHLHIGWGIRTMWPA